jgi:hypothetical protein
MPTGSQLKLGITGHRGLPPETTKLVTSALRAAIDELPKPVIGVSLLADGPDAIFADEIVHIGGQLEVIVPAARYRDRLPAEHHATYDRLLSRAVNVQRLDYAESTEGAHMAASEAMLDKIDLLLAVWDGKPARGFGGTADVVGAARDRGIPVTIVWPVGASRD